ncbi:MAG: SDR family oxidoreductase, partial [Clostridiales bacterium]|nr:SDR family oxidoreductase [Clostridiales bacterium]
MDFTNKVAVITGGASGIGRCIVETFAKAGAKTAVIDLAEESIPCDLYFQGDIAEEAILERFAAAVCGRFKTVDYLIHNACMSKGGLLSGCSYEDFLYIQKIGVAAPYLLTKLFVPNFAENAAVVNIASTRATMSQPDTESYTAAKGGIAALTHALAVSLSGRIRVNAISPGWIDTTGDNFPPEDHRQHPAGRIGKPSDIADAVLFLCGENAGFITGENLTV